MSVWGIIGTIAGCVTAVTAFVGVIVAAFGLKTWRKQLRGTVEYDLARRLLLQAYKVREALGYVRHPFLGVAEAGDVPKGVPWEAVALESEVVWGSVIVPIRRALKAHVMHLLFAVEMYIKAKQDPVFKGDYTKELRDTLYFTAEDDDYNKQLREVLAPLEKLVRPHLKR